MSIKFVRRIINIGGSYKVAIPPPVIESVGLHVGDHVEISLTAEGDAILIRPIRSAGEKQPQAGT